MKKTYIPLLVMVLLLPAFAFSNTITFRLGYFIPRAGGGPDSLWNIEFENMSFKKTDFQESMIGFNYEYFLTKELSLAVSVDTYNKNKAGYYRDFVGYSFDEGDFAFPADVYRGEFTPAHSFNVSIVPIQFSLKLTPFGRRSRIIPFIGGGVGVYFWSVVLRGDMVDFSNVWEYEYEPGKFDDIYYIEPTNARESNRLTFGYHAFGGIMFPIGNRLTLEASVRYNVAKGKFRQGLDASFDGFEDFDLGGLVLAAGINYWF